MEVEKMMSSRNYPNYHKTYTPIERQRLLVTIFGNAEVLYGDIVELAGLVNTRYDHMTVSQQNEIEGRSLLRASNLLESVRPLVGDLYNWTLADLLKKGGF